MALCTRDKKRHAPHRYRKGLQSEQILLCPKKNSSTPKDYDIQTVKDEQDTNRT
jgi:hypothetical protein